MDGLKLQQQYLDAVMSRPPEPYPLPFAAWLDTLDRSALAYVANRTLEQPNGHAWESRDQATRALLHWDATQDDTDRVARDRIVRWMHADQQRADEEYLRVAAGGPLPVVSASSRIDIVDDDPEAWAQL
jgi:hypothetical protein